MERCGHLPILVRTWSLTKNNLLDRLDGLLRKNTMKNTDGVRHPKTSGQDIQIRVHRVTSATTCFFLTKDRLIRRCLRLLKSDLGSQQWMLCITDQLVPLCEKVGQEYLTVGDNNLFALGIIAPDSSIALCNRCNRA